MTSLSRVFTSTYQQHPLDHVHSSYLCFHCTSCYDWCHCCCQWCLHASWASMLHDFHECKLWFWLLLSHVDMGMTRPLWVTREQAVGTSRPKRGVAVPIQSSAAIILWVVKPTIASSLAMRLSDLHMKCIGCFHWHCIQLHAIHQGLSACLPELCGEWI